MPSPRGFTLIELVVVMAIIAILALMAVPTFHDKHIREQVIEAMRLTDIAKGPIAAAWAATKAFPMTTPRRRLPVADKVVSNYVKSLTVEAGAIVVFGNQASGALRGMTLSLRPAVIEDAPIVPVAWVCGFAAPPEKMTVMAANKTDLQAAGCRSTAAERGSTAAKAQTRRTLGSATSPQLRPTSRTGTFNCYCSGASRTELSASVGQ